MTSKRHFPGSIFLLTPVGLNTSGHCIWSSVHTLHVYVHIMCGFKGARTYCIISADVHVLEAYTSQCVCLCVCNSDFLRDANN